MGILGALMRRREPPVEYRTIDGGHPAPFPDMTDEQLYNYETTFNVPQKTFDKPPFSTEKEQQPAELQPRLPENHPRSLRPSAPAAASDPDAGPAAMRPLDFSRPVRTVTTRQPVDILTTRARHPVYKVHGYIGEDDVVTAFTLDGRLSENGPQFLENVPQKQQVHLNIYPNSEPNAKEKYRVTQHESRAEADACAQAGRVACVAVQFDV